VQLEELPPEISVALDDSEPSPQADLDEEVGGSEEMTRVRSALDTHHWHHARAAAELGISRTTLWRKMRAFGLT
jgi:transcriptional regulator of acetoin/glycerol metabolism